MDNISKTIDPKIRLIVTILLLFSGFVSLASQTMMITALPVIEHEMNVSLTLVQWLTTRVHFDDRGSSRHFHLICMKNSKAQYLFGYDRDLYLRDFDRVLCH